MTMLSILQCNHLPVYVVFTIDIYVRRATLRTSSERVPTTGEVHRNYDDETEERRSTSKRCTIMIQLRRERKQSECFFETSNSLKHMQIDSGGREEIPLERSGFCPPNRFSPPFEFFSFSSPSQLLRLPLRLSMTSLIRFSLSVIFFRLSLISMLLFRWLLLLLSTISIWIFVWAVCQFV